MKKNCTKLFSLVSLALIFGVISTQHVRGINFSSVIENLPLMHGFSEDKDSAVIFESPGGRIIETSAVGKGVWIDISGFYKKSLPELGWKTKSSTSYIREGELLNLELVEKDSEGKVRILFKITPIKNKD